MSKITDYPLVNSPDLGDVLLIDGTNGTRILPVEKAGIGLDATLTQAGKAADAKETGDKLSSLKSDVSGDSVAVDLNDLTRMGFIINAQNKWSKASSSSASRGGILDVTDCSSITLTIPDGGVIAFLDTVPETIVAGGSPDFSDLYTARIVFETGATETYPLDNTCNYFYFAFTTTAGGDIMPTNVSVKSNVLRGTDTTLSLAGQAADARETGYQIEYLKTYELPLNVNLGTKLTVDDNLDDKKDYGVYLMQTAAIAQAVSGGSLTRASRVIVSAVSSASHFMQIAFSEGTERTTVRVRWTSGSTWTDWVRLLDNSDFSLSEEGTVWD